MKQAILKKLRANEQKMVVLLSDMVKITSISGKETALAEYVNDYCLNLGFDSHIDTHGNVIAVVKGKQPGKRLAFNSHLDTVPIGDGWTCDPFGAEIVDNRMYGRGTSDCKAAIASQIMAVKSLLEAGVDFAGEIALCYVVEEEVPNISRKGTLKLLQDGFSADMAINGEDTDCRVCLACAGMLEVKITTIGVGAHGATPYKGKNAIKMMCKVIKEIDKLVPGYNKYIGSGSINAGVILGGERSSVVPDRCELKVSRFTVPGETGPMFYAQILGIIECLEAEDADFNATVDLTYESNSSITAEDEQIVKSIINAHSMLDLDCPITGTPQHVDADFLINIGRIPTVIYGPGSGLMAHMPDEYVLLDELVTAAKVYALTVYDALKI